MCVLQLVLISCIWRGVYLPRGGVPAQGECTYWGGVPTGGVGTCPKGCTSPGGVPARGGCTCLGGVPAQGVYLPRGCTCLGGVPAWGVYLPRGVYLPGGCTCWGGCTCLGWYLPGGLYLPGGCTCRGVYLPGGCTCQGRGVYHVTYPIMHLMLPVCCLLTNCDPPTLQLLI